MERFLFLAILFLISTHSNSQSAQSLGSPINTLEFAEFAPTISADGKTMIFESNRGGKVENVAGDFWRLYITYQIKPNIWSEPKDLEVINNFVVKQNYLGGPCLSYDGTTLFFTSNRHGG